MTIKLRILLCVLMLELAGYGLVLFLNYRASHEGLSAAREQQIAATFLGYLHKINALTDAMERNAVDLAGAGEAWYALREHLRPEQLLPQMQRQLVRNFASFPEAIGGGWWYEPFIFDPDRKYFGPYAYRDGEAVRFTWDLSTPVYDYPTQRWYLHALPETLPRDRAPERRMVWTEPYYDDAGSKALMMTVDAIMTTPTGRVLGMATVDWSTEGMREFVAAIKVTPRSFSFLIDQQSGRFVSFVADHGLVMTPAREQEWAPPVLDQARAGELRNLRQVDWHGRAHRVYFIATDVGLVLGLFIPEDDVLRELLPGLRQNLLYGALVSVSFILLMALALTFLFRPFQRVLAQISRSLRSEGGKLALTPLDYRAKNEFTPIVQALNGVFAHISLFTASLASANRELEETHKEINEFNASLELKVKQRTEELAQKNEALVHSLTELRDTQKQLVDAEKHAALNQLVAGVAHEVNTPLGIAITAGSHLNDQLSRLRRDVHEGAPHPQSMSLALAAASEALDITLNNLQRAASLVRSFKQISADQSSEARRRFKVREYLEDILLSLRPRLKRTPHHVRVDCPQDIDVDSYPGALSQVVTNLVINALVHAYGEGQVGHIEIRARAEGERYVLTFVDDGKGIAPDHLPHIFEPFFTTSRRQGGTGLGLHIVFNLVTQTLHGRIRCESTPGAGTVFELDLPQRAP